MRVFIFLVFVLFGVEAATSCRNIGTIKIATIPKKIVATSGEFLSRFLTEVEGPVGTIAAERLRVALTAKYSVELCPEIDTPESSFAHTTALVYHSETYPSPIDCLTHKGEPSATFFYTEEPFTEYPEELLKLYDTSILNVAALDPAQYGKLASSIGTENLSKTILIPLTIDESDNQVKEAFDNLICSIDGCAQDPHDVMLLFDSTSSFSSYRPVVSDAIEVLNASGVSTTLASFSDKAFYPASSGIGGYTFRLESNIGMAVPSNVLDVPNVSGGDEREDQLGAVVTAVDILKSKAGTFKTVILFTDSFPHTKGDYVSEGESEYQDVDFVLKHLRAEAVSLVIVTPPELIEDYSALISGVPFVPIDTSTGIDAEYLKAVVQAQKCGDDWLLSPDLSVSPVRNRDAEILLLLDRGGFMIPIESDVKEGTKAAVRKIVSEFFQSNIGLGLISDDPKDNPYSNAISFENLIPLTSEKNLIFYALERLRFSGGIGQEVSLLEQLLEACAATGSSGIWPRKAPLSRSVLRSCVLITNSYCTESDMDKFVSRKIELGDIVVIVLIEENARASCGKIENEVVMESFDTRGHISVSQAFDLAIERILGPGYVMPPPITTEPSAGGEGGFISSTSPSPTVGISTLSTAWMTSPPSFSTTKKEEDRLVFRLMGRMVDVTKKNIDSIVKMVPSDSVLDWGEFAKAQLDAIMAQIP
eukprot:GHVP01038986.1.p1 GENE.GHVP01038986.1~~GHVP01038986.1.p1  ORF type:complete len:704 (-),score=125.90 GHVP01038986.1:56-2167(-)